jgi:hypothetical protein
MRVLKTDARKQPMIWLDEKAVDLYSRVKARFGFSDELASKILGVLWEKVRTTQRPMVR